jgi:predicted peptidase
MAALMIVRADAQTPKDDPNDYKKVNAELLPMIQAMKSGVHEGGGTKVPWRLHIPPQASQDDKLPLLFFLHGAGRRGDDTIGPMDLAVEFLKPEAQAKYPCFILTPQCRKGTMWTEMNPTRTNLETSEEPTPELAGALAILDQVLAEQPVDTSRIYITGQSMGGFGTWDALVRRPDLFAAAVPICGGGDPAKAAAFKHVPVWAWHGSNDKAVPPENTRAIIEALREAGGDPKYSEINAGHGSWEPAYSSSELMDWLFAQKKK